MKDLKINDKIIARVVCLILLLSIIVYGYVFSKKDSKVNIYNVDQRYKKSKLVLIDGNDIKVNISDEKSADRWLIKQSNLTASQQVDYLRQIRGDTLTAEQREQYFKFLSGEAVTSHLGLGSIRWIADGILIVLRMENPHSPGLAGKLGEIAFRSQTDPVVRDYIMQHLGHIWEDSGYTKQIETDLWRGANNIIDETTCGTSLLTLHRGFTREKRVGAKNLVHERALELVENSRVSLPNRITALVIAGEVKDDVVMATASRLINDPEAPKILRTVASQILK